MTISAKKSLGQNFLNNEETLQKIVAAADLKPTDHIVEIGPGKGALTTQLIKKAKQVTAIELDDRLIPFLNKKFDNKPHFTLLHQDALTFAPPETPYKLVANIPYYITSPLINHFLREQSPSKRPTEITLLVQKEVAEKICAHDGKMSVLAMQVHLFGTPQLIAIVPPEHFDPAPKVDSAILHIKLHKKPHIPNEEIPKFFKTIHRAFAQKRKKLTNNLNIDPQILTELGIDKNARAETLSLNDWLRLIRHQGPI